MSPFHIDIELLCDYAATSVVFSNSLITWCFILSLTFLLWVRKKLGCLQSCKEEVVGLKKYQSFCSSVSVCYCGQSCRSQQSDRNCAQLQCSCWSCICVSPLNNMHEFTLRCFVLFLNLSLMWPGSKLLMPISSFSPLETFHETMHGTLWGIKM